MIKALSGVESVLLRRNLTSATFELPSYRIKVLTGSNKSITSALEVIHAFTRENTSSEIISLPGYSHYCHQCFSTGPPRFISSTEPRKDGKNGH